MRDNPLSSVLGKLQGADNTTPMGNMAKSILEDLGANNPELPADMVRNIPYSALTNPLPCPTGAQIDPAKLAAGQDSVQAGNHSDDFLVAPSGGCRSDSIIHSVSPAVSDF